MALSAKEGTMKKYRFVGNGTYGGRSRAAFVPYIGYLFRGDEVFHDEEAKVLRFVRPNMPPVEATDQALSVLHGGEFNAELTCEHRFFSGEGCAKKPLDGSTFCSFHKPKSKAATTPARPSLVDAGVLPKWPDLPRELVAAPDAVLLESIPSMPSIVPSMPPPPDTPDSPE